MHALTRATLAFARQEALPLPPARLLVGLSGGADSVALLLCLKEAGYALVAAHCHFHLRGAESDRDESFCRTLCAAQGIPLVVTHFATREEAARTGESIEMAARRLRYAWFEAQRVEHGCQAVAVAHHRGDNAETLLLNLLRGAGLNGLTGMRPRRDHIVRPLLTQPRSALLDFLQAQHQSYVTDSTNADTRYRRNYVRHTLLPALQQLNPAAEETLVATAARLAESAALQEHAVETVRQALPRRDGALLLPLPHATVTTALGQLTVSRTLLLALLAPYGFTPATINKLFASSSLRTGARYDAPDYTLCVHGDTLELHPNIPDAPAITLTQEGQAQLPCGARLTTQLLAREALTEIPRSPYCFSLDADRLAPQLQLRYAATGDRFQPFGLRGGTQLVSDFLTNRHCSTLTRAATPVVVSDGVIAAVLGHRPATPFALTPATRRVCLLHYTPATFPALTSPSL